MLSRKVKSPRRKAALDQRKLLDEAQRTVSDFMRTTVKPEFQAVTRDWKTPVNWAIKVRVTQAEIRAEIVPTGKGKTIFGYVDKGTRPHVIKPKGQRRRRGGAALLAFQTGYDARTQPVAQANAGSGRASGGWVFARQVNHPGTAARLFSETIHKQTDPEFRRMVENLMRRMARRNEA